MSQPLVSVCVPTYNRAGFLRESLPTILAQDYSPLEIVISDNGSDDDTEEICRAAAAHDPRVRYIRQPRNIGLYQNHNFLIGAARGDFLGFFHDDDQYTPGIVGEYLRFLGAHPRAGLVCSDWELIDDDGRLIGVRDSDVPTVTPGRDYVERTIRSGRSTVGCPGALIRRAALGEIRFDESGPIGFGDFVVWFQIAERWGIGHVTGRLWRYRLHRGSLSGRKIESIVRDYEQAIGGYCDGFEGRWPAETDRAERWRALTRRFIFWALAYELSLQFRPARRPTTLMAGRGTMFELKGYRLSPEELESVRRRLGQHRTGGDQWLVHGMIELLMTAGLTRPLGWITRYPLALRAFLGVR